MSRQEPKDILELALLIEHSMEEVQLEEDEIQEVIATGSDLNKLMARVQGELSKAKELARREKFKAAQLESQQASQRYEAALQQRRKSAPRPTAFFDAVSAQAHFHKLRTLSKEEAKQIMEEIEILSSEHIDGPSASPEEE